MKKVILIIILVSITALTTIVSAQTSKNCFISGIASNTANNPVGSVWVILKQNNKEIGKSLTGDDGKFYIGILAEGTYDVEVKRGNKVLFNNQVSLPRDKNYNIKL